MAVFGAVAACAATAGACSSSASKSEPRAQEDGRAEPAATEPVRTEPVRIEPSGAFDGMAKAIGGKLDPSGPAMTAAVWPHLAPLARDCAAGSDVACMAQTELYAHVVDAARRARAAETPAFETGCGAGDQMACALWGDAVDDDSGTSRETSRSIALLAKACDAGLAIACARVATIRLESGVPAPELTEARAIALLEPACAAGQAFACRTLYSRLGARDDSPFEDATAYYTALVRVCRLGDRSACGRLVRELTPAPPFGCDQCPAASEGGGAPGDYRCQDCEIARCRRENCCATCAGRTKYACCSDDGGAPREYPERAPPLARARLERALDAARRGTARARAIWQAACERGYRPSCASAEQLDRALAELSATPTGS